MNFLYTSYTHLHLYAHEKSSLQLFLPIKCIFSSMQESPGVACSRQSEKCIALLNYDAVIIATNLGTRMGGLKRLLTSIYQSLKYSLVTRA